MFTYYKKEGGVKKPIKSKGISMTEIIALSAEQHR